MAKGKMQTHAAGWEEHMGFLASLAAELGASAGLIETIHQANTARHVLDLCREAGLIGITTLMCRKVTEHCTHHQGDWRYGPASWISGAVCLGVTRRRFHERHAGGILSTMMSGLEKGFLLDRQWLPNCARVMRCVWAPAARRHR